MVDWAGVCGVASDTGDYDHETYDPVGHTGDVDTRKTQWSKSMKNEIQGVVEEYFTKQVQNGSFLHSLTVGGSKYSVFSQDDKRRANEGDTVSFTAEENKGYWNIAGNFKVLKRATGHQSKQKQSYAPKEDDRQASIIRQNAMTQANSLIAGLVGAGRFAELSENELAAEVIRLADEYFFPYAKDGSKP